MNQDQVRDFWAQVAPHQQELLGVAMRMCRDPDAARDLVQECLLKALVGWDSYSQGTHLRAWLHRILQNAFINDWRKQRRHQLLAKKNPNDVMAALYGDACAEDADPPALAAIREQVSDEVLAALGRLSRDYREVVERCDLRGQSYREIADALDLPIGTVMSRLHRARRQLADTLEDYAAREHALGRPTIIVSDSSWEHADASVPAEGVEAEPDSVDGVMAGDDDCELGWTEAAANADAAW